MIPSSFGPTLLHDIAWHPIHFARNTSLPRSEPSTDAKDDSATQTDMMTDRQFIDMLPHVKRPDDHAELWALYASQSAASGCSARPSTEKLARLLRKLLELTGLKTY